jgi:hypothetical protein
LVGLLLAVQSIEDVGQRSKSTSQVVGECRRQLLGQAYIDVNRFLGGGQGLGQLDPARNVHPRKPQEGRRQGGLEGGRVASGEAAPDLDCLLDSLKRLLWAAQLRKIARKVVQRSSELGLEAGRVGAGEAAVEPDRLLAGLERPLVAQSDRQMPRLFSALEGSSSKAAGLAAESRRQISIASSLAWSACWRRPSFERLPEWLFSALASSSPKAAALTVARRRQRLVAVWGWPGPLHPLLGLQGTLVEGMPGG